VQTVGKLPGTLKPEVSNVNDTKIKINYLKQYTMLTWVGLNRNTLEIHIGPRSSNRI